MKNKKIIFYVVISLILICACIYYFINKNKSDLNSNSINKIDTEVDLDTSDEKIDWNNYDTKNITLSEPITLKESGVYYLTGEITDGLVIINTEDNIKLVLNNVTITNKNGPAIYVKSADNLVICTEENSINTLNDGNTYSGYDDDVEGAIYSKDDLILEGSGTLVVNGNKSDGVVGKDDLKINSGTYVITSKDDAIRGKDSVYIKDGIFTINANGDGIKSTNDSETDKGYVKIETGTFNITSETDGIQAETKLIISSGTFNIKTGGGSSNSSTKSEWGKWGTTTTSDSAKGLKATGNIVIEGGTFTLDTSDDSIHSNNYVGISGGIFELASGDDGIHADSELIIDAGEISITKSYEGLESENLTINGGVINIVSSDDGMNAAGGNDGSGNNRPGNPNTSTSSNSKITINGGTIYINATGDGIDSNGSIYITAGTITVDGPTDDGNGPLDYENKLVMKGGTLIAIGSSGMAQGISDSSNQYGVLIKFSKNYYEGTTISILDSNNQEILSYTAKKKFSSLAYSSSSLLKDNTYTIKVDGEEYTTFTINNINTTIGFSSMGGGNPNQNPGQTPNQRRK